jgi:hypothetical protein
MSDPKSGAVSLLQTMLGRGAGADGGSAGSGRQALCRLILSALAVCVAGAPLCAVIGATWVWGTTHDLSDIWADLRAFGRACALGVAPYLLWFLVICAYVRLRLRGNVATGVRAIGVAAGFWVPYLLVWPVAIAWPFLVMLLDDLVLDMLCKSRTLWYLTMCGGSAAFVALGLTLTVLRLAAISRRASEGAGRPA